MEYNLAQINIAKFKSSINETEMQEFIANLDPVNVVEEKICRG